MTQPVITHTTATRRSVHASGQIKGLGIYSILYLSARKSNRQKTERLPPGTMLSNKEALIRVPVSQNDCRIRFMLRCNSAKRFRFFLYANAKQMQAIITDTEANPHRSPPINTIEQVRPTNALRHGWDSIVQPRQTQTPAMPNQRIAIRCSQHQLPSMRPSRKRCTSIC